MRYCELLEVKLKTRALLRAAKFHRGQPQFARDQAAHVARLQRRDFTLKRSVRGPVVGKPVGGPTELHLKRTAIDRRVKRTVISRRAREMVKKKLGKA